MGRNPFSKYILKKPKHASQLVQSNQPKHIIDASARDRALFSGSMGGCCSVIFCWQVASNGEYQFMRGYHGSGGPQAIPWAQFVMGVPNNAFTLAWIAAAPADSSHLDRAKELLATHNLGAVNVQTMLTTNLKVNRRGVGSDASGTNYQTEYQVANLGVFDL